MLAYVMATQRPDGGWSQNGFPDGRPFWTGVQLDEVGFPILLAAKLEECGALDGLGGVAAMIHRAASYLAHNGPISLKNFSGEADVRAVNGPISVDGSSGNVRVHTENGPISVSLTGKTWSGTGLSADAQNGPLTLMVPNGYQSGFIVESRNYAPMSCQASICDNARKTWDDNNRRIEYGSTPAMIRLSTVNGPVSVRDEREKL
jgi:hypothetical protein